MVDGRQWGCSGRTLIAIPECRSPGKKRRLSFRRAYWHGCEFVKQYLREEAKTWAQRAGSDLERRLRDLERHFGDLGEDGDRPIRLEEESLRFSPKVLVSLRGGALIYWKRPPSALAVCEFPAQPSPTGEAPADAPGPFPPEGRGLRHIVFHAQQAVEDD